MAKVDLEKLAGHTDEQHEGKAVCSLQHGPGEIRNAELVEGLANQVEIPVQAIAGQLASTEELRTVNHKESFCDGFISHDPVGKNHSGDIITPGFAEVGNATTKTELGSGPWQERGSLTQSAETSVFSRRVSGSSLQEMTGSENGTSTVFERKRAVVDPIPNSDFSMLDAMSGIPTTGIASGLVGPLVLKDRFNRWIDATAPLARELTSVAAAKAGISVPGGIKSWLGSSWTSPNKVSTHSTGSPPGEHMSDTRPTGSKSLNASPVKKAIGAIHSRNASTDGIASSMDLDIGFQVASSNSAVERGNQLMQELKQSLKIVLGEVVKGDGKPLGDGVYAITLFCGFLDQALAHGLKDGRRRWATWSSSKNPPSFLNLLEALEQRLPSEPGPENEDYRGSLGLDEVRSLNWVQTSGGRLRAWIRQSLNSGLVGARLRLVVEHVDLLQHWYEAWSLLRREDTSDELLSIVMALNAVQTNLSVGLGVGLDHQKYALLENLFTLDGSKSGNESVERMPIIAYPTVEDGSLTTYYSELKNNLKYSKHRVVSVHEEEANSHGSIASNVIPAFVDTLSPPGSPYDSPKITYAGLETTEVKKGIELLETGSTYGGLIVDGLSPTEGPGGYLDAVEVPSLKEAVIDKIMDEKTSEVGLSDEDDFSDRSMFAVDSDDDERRGLSSVHVKRQWPVVNADAEVLDMHNGWADFEHENTKVLDNFQSIFEEMKAERSGNAVDAKHTSTEGGHLGMNDEFAQASELVDGANLGMLEEMVGQVKGTGRPDLDEDEEDECNDITEKVSLLSDFEEEEYESEAVVGPLPQVTSESEDYLANDRSSRLQVGSLEERVVKGPVGSDDLKLLGEGPLGVVQSNPFVPPASEMLREDAVKEEGDQPVHTSAGTGFLSESDEDILSDPRANARDHVRQNLDMAIDSSIPLPGKLSISQPGEESAQATVLQSPGYASSVMSGLESGLKVLEADSLSPVKADAKETTRKKGAIMRLGSKEAEELLQLDLTKMGRAILLSVKKGGTGAKSPKVPANGIDWGADDLGPDELSRYVETLEVKETYLDTILDMEDVLLDSDDNHRPHAFHPSKSMFATPVHKVDRDGSRSASTSGVPWAAGNRSFQLSTNHLVEVAWVEVVGARQRKGGASFSERVVGVQEHTVYRILVRSTDGQEWEIERRYRDFVSLFQQLNHTFPAEGAVSLPSPWDRVRAESRKLFGNTSPNVVEVRSALIQVCLQSLLQAGPPLCAASPFLRFLYPTTWSAAGRTLLQRAASEDLRPGGNHGSRDEFGSEPAFSPTSDTTGVVAEGETDNNSGAQSVFGKTIRLKLQVYKKKPLAQQMQAQHQACAGCYRPLASSVGLIPGLAQSFGLSGPRWCEYSGQLYCSSCHLNETAVIPAYVVQHWDFGMRPVSQLAKAYLDSIYDKPMLCVSAVNPYLYFRVPILVHLRETRKRLSKMLAYIRCPSRSRFQAMVGSRRYLLESNDFYALRDLTDLSKGAFAGLPAFMNTLLEKLTAHIKRECSICHEMGEPCGAAKWCKDPLDIIFPFQEEGIVRCSTCQLPFHKLCFARCKICPSCNGGKSLDNGEISQPEDITSTPSTSIVLSKSSAVSTPSNDVHVPAEVSRRPRKKKSNFLSGLLTPKNSSSKDANPGRQDSVVLDMRELSGPLEL